MAHTNKESSNTFEQANEVRPCHFDQRTKFPKLNNTDSRFKGDREVYVSFALRVSGVQVSGKNY